MTIKIAAALEVARGKKIAITFKPENPNLKKDLGYVHHLRNNGLVHIDSDDLVLMLSVISSGKWPTCYRTITLSVTDELNAASFTRDLSHALADIEVVA